MSNSFADEDPEMTWEKESRKRVQYLLRNAKWEFDTKQVSFPLEGDDRSCHYPVSTSMEELRQYLADEYNSQWYANVPFENGTAVFETDDDVYIVDEELTKYTEQLSKLGWEL